MTTDNSTKAVKTSHTSNRIGKIENTPRSSGSSCKTERPLPVSQRFYNSLMERVEEILTAIYGESPHELRRGIQRIIDQYLSGGMEAIPERGVIPEVRIIFLTLKAEIDSAIQRSRRARESARQRATKRVNRTPMPSAQPAEESSIEPSATIGTTIKSHPDGHYDCRDGSKNEFT